MTLEEVASEIELGRWRLKLQRMGRTVILQVRVDIGSLAQSDIELTNFGIGFGELGEG